MNLTKLETAIVIGALSHDFTDSSVLVETVGKESSEKLLKVIKQMEGKITRKQAQESSISVVKKMVDHLLESSE